MYRNKVGSRPTAEEIIITSEVKTAVHSGKSIDDNGTGLWVNRYQRIPSSRADQWSTSCVQTPFPVPVITYRPTVLPAKMDQFTRVLMTMANIEQDGTVPSKSYDRQWDHQRACCSVKVVWWKKQNSQIHAY